MAAGSVPALPTQQMLITSALNKTEQQQQQLDNNNTQNKMRYTGDRAKERERERGGKGRERERIVSFTTFVCSGVKGGNYSEEESAKYIPTSDKASIKSSTIWEATQSVGQNGELVIAASY